MFVPLPVAVVATARVPPLAEERSTSSVAEVPRVIVLPSVSVVPVPPFGSTVIVLFVPAASVRFPSVCAPLPVAAPRTAKLPPPRLSADVALSEPVERSSSSVPAFTVVAPV